METRLQKAQSEPEVKPPRMILPPSTNLISSLARVARRNQDVVQVFSPVLNFYFLNKPELVHEVLVTKHSYFSKGDVLRRGKKVFGDGLLTSEGEFHHRQKRLVQQAFYSSKIANYVDTIIDYTDRMLNSWKGGELRDIHKEMTHLTMFIIAKCMLNLDIDSARGGIVEALSDVVEYFDRVSGPFAWFFENLHINARYEASLKRVSSLIYDTIRNRNKSNQDFEDILSILLCTRDSSGCPAMSEKQVHDEALILLAAGHETTANALSWVWYLLSQNPKVEEKLDHEIELVLGEERSRPLAKDVSKLCYTRKVFKETLRLYPPAWTIIRQAVHKVRIGRYEIPRGANVLMSQYILQRDARYFPNPERFDPDRWKGENPNLADTAYFPFGGGPRSCVGEPFAWTEGVLIIARIASRWKLELPRGKSVDVLPRTTLRPKKGIRMRVVLDVSSAVKQ